MPLSRPASRNHIHTRDVHCRGFHRADGLWDLEATMVDTKTYSFDNADRGGIASGEAIHNMALRLTVDDDLVIRDVEAVADAGPFDLCAELPSTYAELKGLRIGPGWRKAVLERLGRTKGCTHLTELLLGPLAATAYQTVKPAGDRRNAAAPDGARPAILDTCHALGASSPVVRKHWPDFYEGG